MVQTPPASQPPQVLQMDPQYMQADVSVAKNETHPLAVESDEPQQIVLLSEGDLKKGEEPLKLVSEPQHDHETPSSPKTEMSLKGNLEVQSEQMENTQNLNNWENEKMSANLEKEQNDGDVQLKGDNQDTVLMDQWQIKVNQLALQLCEKDKEVLNLMEENEGLSRSLQQMMEKLRSQEVEFLHSKNEWQLTNKNLQRELQEMLSERQEMAASLVAEKQKVSEQMETIVQLTEDHQTTALLKKALQLKVNQYKLQLRQKDKELQSLWLENGSVSRSLHETTENLQRLHAEFLQSKNGWQLKYNELQEKLREEVEEKVTMVESMEAERQKVYGQLDENIKLKEDNPDNVLLQNLLWMKLNWYNKKLCDKEQELVTLQEDNERLSRSLQETTENLQKHEAEFLQSEDSWQSKYNHLQEELAEKEQVWDTKASGQKRVTDKLLESNKAWQEIYDALQEKFRQELLLNDQSWESTVKQLEDEMEGLEEEVKELKEELLQHEKELKAKPKKSKKKAEREEATSADSDEKESKKGAEKTQEEEAKGGAAKLMELPATAKEDQR